VPVDQPKYQTLLRADADPEFVFIDPPFQFNAAGIVKYSPEVTGMRLLNSMCRRLGWDSFAGKRLMDYGCGVRLARTIINLGVEIGFYAGIDVNKKSIAWLQSNISDSRFRFETVDLPNQLYNKKTNGAASHDTEKLTRLGLTGFDAICMFSVITHQTPEEAETTLTMLRSSIADGGSLYFTALIDDKVETYAELDPTKPGMLSAYNAETLLAIVDRCGWDVTTVYAPAMFQQTTFVCSKRAG
jgi:2-polyprenyl-3-methyl-5-hydroxy-6-metoxy-1,4-benzoquinol methylase